MFVLDGIHLSALNLIVLSTPLSRSLASHTLCEHQSGRFLCQRTSLLQVDVHKLSGAAADRTMMRLQTQAEKAKNMLSGLPEGCIRR
jgi:hypothetical protein